MGRSSVWAPRVDRSAGSPRWVAGLAAAVLGGLLLTGCAGPDGLSGSGSLPSTGSADTVGITTYASGQRPAIPDLTGNTLSGATLSLSQLVGHVVVLNAWASWCGPCREESPALGRLARQTASLGVRFVGIDEEDTADSARSFAASAGTSYPHLIDSDGRMLMSLRLVPPAAIPSTLVLDRAGLVAGRIIGPVDAASLGALIRAVAGESATPAAS